MLATKIQRRWTWKAILLLVAMNALLWASFALSAGHFRVSAARSAVTGCRVLSPR